MTDKKWKWDSDKRTLRAGLSKDETLQNLCTNYVESLTENGASITDTLRYVLGVIDKTKYPVQSFESFKNLTRTDQRLVIRKILHTKYKSGKYTLVESESGYRTGKKAKTLRYVLIGN